MPNKFEYDLSYLLKMLRQNSGSAKDINTKRWDFILGICPEAKYVLDYGSGCNYLSAFSPADVEIDSYDIGVYNGAPYPQTGIRRDNYDVLCLFDSLEHVDWVNDPDLSMLDAISKSKYIVVSVPILPQDKVLDASWKHYKPFEHLTYFTPGTLKQFFEELRFYLVAATSIECPPRQDIGTFAFKRGVI
jgi:hypothetical protein